MARVIEDTGTTVIHEHDGDSSSGMSGLVIGLILLLVVVFLFIYFGLPLLRSAMTPQVNVPSKVDVNVNKTQ